MTGLEKEEGGLESPECHLLCTKPRAWLAGALWGSVPSAHLAQAEQGAAAAIKLSTWQGSRCGDRGTPLVSWPTGKAG